LTCAFLPTRGFLSKSANLALQTGTSFELRSIEIELGRPACCEIFMTPDDPWLPIVSLMLGLK
jgi:hypothetical protein